MISRIQDYLKRKEKPTSIVQVKPENTLHVRDGIGYRDFSLDRVSFNEEDLDSFYKKFMESRINGVRLGAKCTIMICGPIGSKKSHTMFGCLEQSDIVYRSLESTSEGEGSEGGDREKLKLGTFVQVTVLYVCV